MVGQMKRARVGFVIFQGSQRFIQVSHTFRDNKLFY